MTKREAIDRPVLEGPRMYILVRSDIYDLNPGKLGAQTGHAASMLAKTVYSSPGDDNWHHYKEWEGDRGFGTKITLTATQEEIIGTLKYMDDLNLLCGKVVDPTYPFKNYFGEMFTAMELTVGYVFVPMDVDQEALDYLRQFKLHP